MPLLNVAETAIAPYLTWIKLGAAALALVGLLGAGFYAGYRWELGTYEKRVADDAAAQTKAVAEKAASISAQDAVNTAAAISEAQSQTKVEIHTVTVTKEIPTYVHDKISCPGPTVGLARVLFGAASATDPATLNLAPGQSDDDCSDVTASEVASWFTQYAGNSQGNAQQLNDLESWVTANHAAQVGASK